MRANVNFQVWHYKRAGKTMEEFYYGTFKFFVGSVTHHLIHETEILLFLYH